jgi:hypothetical protein
VSRGLLLSGLAQGEGRSPTWAAATGTDATPRGGAVTGGQ